METSIGWRPSKLLAMMIDNYALQVIAIAMFADNSKLYRTIRNPSVTDNLQQDLNYTTFETGQNFGS